MSRHIAGRLSGGVLEVRAAGAGRMIVWWAVTGVLLAAVLWWDSVDTARWSIGAHASADAGAPRPAVCHMHKGQGVLASGAHPSLVRG